MMLQDYTIQIDPELQQVVIFSRQLLDHARGQWHRLDGLEVRVQDDEVVTDLIMQYVRDRHT